MLWNIKSKKETKSLICCPLAMADQILFDSTYTFSVSLWHEILLGLYADTDADFGVVSVHHVGLLCENLERSLSFYQNLLGIAPFIYYTL